MNFEQGTSKHCKLLSELSSKAFWESHHMSASKEDLDFFISQTYSEEAYARELADQSNIFYIAYHYKQAAGYSKVVLNVANENIKEQNITKLDRIYLLKEFYGQNLGEELFQLNVEWSKKHFQAGIWLAVWVENDRAINFYKKVGFQIVGSYDFKISETHSNPNHIMYLKF